MGKDAGGHGSEKVFEGDEAREQQEKYIKTVNNHTNAPPRIGDRLHGPWIKEKGQIYRTVSHFHGPGARYSMENEFQPKQGNVESGRDRH